MCFTSWVVLSFGGVSGGPNSVSCKRGLECLPILINRISVFEPCGAIIPGPRPQRQCRVVEVPPSYRCNKCSQQSTGRLPSTLCTPSDLASVG
eukprot:4372093-Amphidinium_carterae.1